MLFALLFNMLAFADEPAPEPETQGTHEAGDSDLKSTPENKDKKSKVNSDEKEILTARQLKAKFKTQLNSLKKSQKELEAAQKSFDESYKKLTNIMNFYKDQTCSI